mmetsp:Transcript_65321/g.147371  ORF Transcript_65321/g.147371 Transcript_65321/m.147371 type:complete len:627 (-) Transcript_65321:268-2148(-)
MLVLSGATPGSVRIFLDLSLEIVFRSALKNLNRSSFSDKPELVREEPEVQSVDHRKVKWHHVVSFAAGAARGAHVAHLLLEVANRERPPEALSEVSWDHGMLKALQDEAGFAVQPIAEDMVDHERVRKQNPECGLKVVGGEARVVVRALELDDAGQDAKQEYARVLGGLLGGVVEGGRDEVPEHPVGDFFCSRLNDEEAMNELVQTNGLHGLATVRVEVGVLLRFVDLGDRFHDRARLHRPRLGLPGLLGLLLAGVLGQVGGVQVLVVLEQVGVRLRQRILRLLVETRHVEGRVVLDLLVLFESQRRARHGHAVNQPPDHFDVLFLHRRRSPHIDELVEPVEEGLVVQKVGPGRHEGELLGPPQVVAPVLERDRVQLCPVHLARLGPRLGPRHNQEAELAEHRHIPALLQDARVAVSPAVHVDAHRGVNFHHLPEPLGLLAELGRTLDLRPHELRLVRVEVQVPLQPHRAPVLERVHRPRLDLGPDLFPAIVVLHHARLHRLSQVRVVLNLGQGMGHRGLEGVRDRPRQTQRRLQLQLGRLPEAEHLAGGRPLARGPPAFGPFGRFAGSLFSDLGRPGQTALAITGTSLTIACRLGIGLPMETGMLSRTDADKQRRERGCDFSCAT